jgi:hypothetical protein
MAKPDPTPPPDDDDDGNPTMIVFVIHGGPAAASVWRDPLSESERAELESHMKALLGHEATRRIWERVQGMLSKLVIETGDIEAGRNDYAMAVELWRQSRFYDGED